MTSQASPGNMFEGSVPPLTKAINPMGIKLLFLGMAGPAHQPGSAEAWTSVHALSRLLKTMVLNHGLQPESPEKVSKSLAEPFGLESQKSPTKGGKSPKRHFLETFADFFDIFETPGQKAREDFLETFLGFRLAGPRDSCKMVGRNATLPPSLSLEPNHPSEELSENTPPTATALLFPLVWCQSSFRKKAQTKD